MREAIVSIGAGAGQVPLLAAARRLGFAVVAVDRDPAAPGLALADAAVAASTHDPHAVRRALAPLAARFRLVAVAAKSSGVPVATAARVARELGLPGLDPAAALLAITKPGTMELAARAGVPVPRHLAARAVEEIAGAGLALPLVLKPSLTTVGKAGISRVPAPEGLAAGFAAARAAAADGIVEVEEHVAGEDVAVAAFFAPGSFHPFALIDEDTRFDAVGRARGFGFAMPSRHAGTAVEHALAGHAARFVRANELGTGAGFFTFRVRPDGTAVLLEVHFDLAGDYVADRLVPAATGIDLLAAALLRLAGRASPPAPSAIRPAAVRFLLAGDLAAGRDAKLARLAALGAGTEVDAAIPPSGAGAVQRVGCVLLRAEDPAALAARIREMDRILGRSSG
ncbi:MAG: hypothetical protein AB1726_11595 [Planctomycetota bacterium]